MRVGWGQGAVREDFLEAAAGRWMGRGSMSSVGGGQIEMPKAADWTPTQRTANGEKSDQLPVA